MYLDLCLPSFISSSLRLQSNTSEFSIILSGLDDLGIVMYLDLCLPIVSYLLHLDSNQTPQEFSILCTINLAIVLDG